MNNSDIIDQAEDKLQIIFDNDEVVSYEFEREFSECIGRLYLSEDQARSYLINFINQKD